MAQKHSKCTQKMLCDEMAPEVNNKTYIKSTFIDGQVSMLQSN